MSILKDIDTTTIDYYGDKFDKIFVDFKIFIFLVLILVLVFVIRFFVLINIEKGKKKNKIEKSTILYILSHTTLELLFAFLISYILIKLTNANPESYIINYIAAPSVGVILAIYLDNKKRLINYKIITIGTKDQTMVHPRDVIYNAIKCNASGIILIHNHPSNDITPSKADIEMTNILINSCNIVGIPLLDHLITNTKEYYSFFKENNI